MEITNHEPLARHWLASEFRRRKEANPAFSLRAFAKQLDVPPGRLSELLSGKRRLNTRLASRFGQRLGISPAKVKALSMPNERADQDHALMEEDTFQVIADWEHIALLSLVETEGFRNDARWIARRLGVSPVEARDSMERLLRVGLLAKDGAKLVKTSAELRTTNEVQSASLRKSHRQTLAQATEALDNVPIAERDITSITMAIDPAKLPLAKELIRDFRYRLSALLEGGKKKEVYNLNVQLVPVTKKEKI